ncbi:hypothetical protein KOAAANKH_00723 [Brevundimonas sp. NIBR10]|uniref:hypothetical protein n=1 Tax=Brevundimonas sp. NIBR10 TaxID=3015997 RepID=UPI0022F19CD2|nr:hypothetical protein [Brevundimonas sp. NIBR10]WGM45859.1 hypothetical protein KOAAANKH_00723 [Brevundimonas sp. NIBR10]
MAGSAAYTVESTGEGGIVLVRQDSHAEEFSRLVRDLINTPNDEYVILPSRDARSEYERVVVLPL